MADKELTELEKLQATVTALQRQMAERAPGELPESLKPGYMRSNIVTVDLGEATGWVKCTTDPECVNFLEPQPVQMKGVTERHNQRDINGNPTENLENSYDRWTLIDQEDWKCKGCGGPCGSIPPDGKSVDYTHSQYGVRSDKEAWKLREKAMGRDTSQTDLANVIAAAIRGNTPA